MYEMYPYEWGPSQHRDQSGDQATDAVQVALDRRDNGGQRPDDS